MTDQIKKQVVACIDAWIEPGNDNRSQRKLARKIGVSDATISHIRKGKTEIGDGIWNKISAFFTSAGLLKIDQSDAWRFFEFTPEATTILAVLENARTHQRRAAIDGPTGKGKSEAVKMFCAKDRTNESFQIICRRAMNPKTFCVNFAETIGLSQIASNRYHLEEDIAEKLLTMGTPIVVIEEAENLSPTCWSSIKAVIDLTDGQCAFVIVGIDIWKMIHWNAGKGKDAFRQIQRRFPVQSYEFLPEGIDPDVMKRILHEVAITDKNAIEWFQENIYDYDALKNTVRDALRISKKHRITIDRVFMDRFFSPKSRKSYRKQVA